VRSLANPAARNAVIELGGPEALCQLEIVRIFEDIAGRKFELEFVPEKQLAARKAAATNPVERTFADLTLSAARGDAIDMNDVSKKFSIQLKPVRDHAKSALSG
jgi:uncharacterized protein YbjT (DUF2867 family)